MTIRRQLNLFYSGVYFLIAGLIISSVSILSYGALYERSTGSLGSIVNTAMNMLEMNYSNVIKNYLKGIAEKDRDLVVYYYQEFQAGRLTEEQAKRSATNALLSQKIGNTGYVYCIDSSGIVRVHPKKELLASDVSANDFVVRQMREKRGYLEYEWANPGESAKRAKAIYMDYFAPWDWIISVSSYRSEFSTLVDVSDFEKGLLDIKVGQTGYLFLLDAAGNLLIHPTMKGQNIAENKDEKGFFYIKDILQKKDGMITYAWKNPDERVARQKIVYFRAIRELDMIVAGGTYTDELLSANARILGLSAIIFLVGFIALFLLGNAIAGSISRPIKSVMELLLAIGRGDLTARISSAREEKTVGRKDEIGEIARAALDMQGKLLELTAAVRDNAAKIQSGADEIVASIDEQAATSSQMSASVSEITSTMEELSASSTQIAEHSKSVVDIANLTWENSKKGTESMRILQEKIEGIRSENQASLREIVELGRKSKEISKVMSIIDAVADQTRLIAFNAALEASSAGEAGKRFGVVAAEIRRLADSVTVSTGEIETKINEIQDSISRLVITSEKGAAGIADGGEATTVTAEFLEELVGAASRTTSAAQQISLSTQQQRTASSQVVVALREIVTASQHTADSIGRIAQISHGTTSMSTELNDLVGLFKVARDE